MEESPNKTLSPDSRKVSALASPLQRDELDAQIRGFFRNILPVERLGHVCHSHQEFSERLRQAQQQNNDVDVQPANTGASPQITNKVFTLVVVTEAADQGRQQRILLGHKQRGFGTGLFNGFGGKLEANESLLEGAQRELLEETGIDVPLEDLISVGTLHFTFDDAVDYEMEVHVFRLLVSTNKNSQKTTFENETTYKRSSQSRAASVVSLRHDIVAPSANDEGNCDDVEIIPQWIEDWRDIPLHDMFADDSVWLTRLLFWMQQQSDERQLLSRAGFVLNGWFHFCAGGAEMNTLKQYFIDVQTAEVQGKTQS